MNTQSKNVQDTTHAADNIELFLDYDVEAAKALIVSLLDHPVTQLKSTLEGNTLGKM